MQRHHNGLTMSQCLVGLLAAVALSEVHAQEGTAARYLNPPRHLDGADYRDVFAQVAPGVYLAGQPSETALSRLPEIGVDTVINLRTHMEMDNRGIVPFDEASVLGELGLEYVHIPLGGPDTPYGPAAVAQLARALDAAEGKVLLHCTVAWRASHLWAAYLIRYLDVPVAEAIAIARQLNFGDIPLEAFLDQPLRIEVVDHGVQHD